MSFLTSSCKVGVSRNSVFQISAQFALFSGHFALVHTMSLKKGTKHFKDKTNK